jgi:hypothetical protein
VTASTLVPAEGPWRLLATWLVRLTAAVAVAACVLLGINAVLDV